jgi:hypothetical protein
MEAGGSRNALDHRRNAAKQRRDSTHRDNGQIPARKAIREDGGTENCIAKDGS